MYKIIKKKVWEGGEIVEIGVKGRKGRKGVGCAEVRTGEGNKLLNL